MESRDRRNAALCIVGEGIWGFHIQLVAWITVLTVLLNEYGAGPVMVGSLSSIEAGSRYIPQVLGLYIFCSRRRRKLHLYLWHVGVMIPFHFIMGFIILYADHLSPVLVRWSLLACFFCFFTGMGIVLAAWMDWMAHIFPVKIRGTVFGLSFGLAALTGTAGALLSGWLIDVLPAPRVYAYLYFGAGLFGWLAMTSFLFFDDPAAQLDEEPRRLRVREMFAHFRTSLGDRNFRQFVIARLIAAAGFSILPFITVYYRSAAGGSLSKPAVVSCQAAMTAGMALGNFGLGRLGDKRGHRLGMLLGSVTQMVCLGIMLTSSGRWSCLVAFAAAGMTVGSGTTSHYNMLYETCPHANIGAHITIGNLLLGVCGAVAALVAGGVAKLSEAGGHGLRPLFALCLVLSAISLAWFVLRVQEPRRMGAGSKKP